MTATAANPRPVDELYERIGSIHMELEAKVHDLDADRKRWNLRDDRTPRPEVDARRAALEEARLLVWERLGEVGQGQERGGLPRRIFALCGNCGCEFTGWQSCPRCDSMVPNDNRAFYDAESVDRALSASEARVAAASARIQELEEELGSRGPEPCPHEHWYVDSDNEGRTVHICEDCGLVTPVSEMGRQEP